MELGPANSDGDEAGGSGKGGRGGEGTIRVLGCPLPRWARWPAVCAFAFFLVKGLVWLSLPLMVVGWRSCSAH